MYSRQPPDRLLDPRNEFLTPSFCLTLHFWEIYSQNWPIFGGIYGQACLRSGHAGLSGHCIDLQRKIEQTQKIIFKTSNYYWNWLNCEWFVLSVHRINLLTLRTFIFVSDRAVYPSQVDMLHDWDDLRRLSARWRDQTWTPHLQAYVLCSG